MKMRKKMLRVLIDQVLLLYLSTVIKYFYVKNTPELFYAYFIKTRLLVVYMAGARQTI